MSYIDTHQIQFHWENFVTFVQLYWWDNKCKSKKASLRDRSVTLKFSDAKTPWHAILRRRICRKIQLTLILKDKKLRLLSGVLPFTDTTTQRYTRTYDRKQLFVSWRSWKSCFQVIYQCLKPFFSVLKWEDTNKHLVSFMSFKTSVYCISQRIG